LAFPVDNHPDRNEFHGFFCVGSHIAVEAQLVDLAEPAQQFSMRKPNNSFIRA
jgi:hypothetical protein